MNKQANHPSDGRKLSATEQLKLLNQQLKAANEQLEATNQQLRASR